MIDLIRELLACNHSDPNRNRAGSGRWITVNVPADLWHRLGAAAATSQCTSDPGDPSSRPSALRVFALAMGAAKDEIEVDICGDRGVPDSPVVQKANRSRAALFEAIAVAEPQQSSLIAGTEVLTAPGAAIKVTRLNLTEEGKAALQVLGPVEIGGCGPALSEERIGAIVEAMPGGLLGYCKTWGWLQFARALEKEHGIGRGSGDALEAFDINPIAAYYAGRLSMRDQAAAVLQSEADALATTASRYPNFADSLGRNVQCLVGLEPKIRGIEP